MNFTNTNSAGKDWRWYILWGEATWPLKEQVNEQVSGYVTDQVYKQVLQINPIRNKIKQEINK